MGRCPFDRASERNRCPLCKKSDWCLISKDGSAVICPRTSEGSVRYIEGAGYLHVLRHGDCDRHVSKTIATIRVGTSTQVDFGKLSSRWRAAVSREALVRFAGELGLTDESLVQLGIGWASPAEIECAGTRCRGPGCWSFPMQNGAGRITGIRLRTPSGFKYAIVGSADGLFVPARFVPGETLIICEGPTDTAALLDMGFTAIGRSSCTGGTKLIVRLVRSCLPRNAILVADGDRPGQEGADFLARSIAPYVRGIKIVTPPNGLKDLRAWKQAGATAADFLESVAAAAAPSKVLITRVTPGEIRQTSHEYSRN